MQIFVKDYPKKLHFIFPTAAFDKEWAALTASFLLFPHMFLADNGYLCQPEPTVGPNMRSVWHKQARLICECYLRIMQMAIK